MALKGFIEIKSRDGHKLLLNVNFIEEVIGKDSGSCHIYMAFNCPNAYDQDHFLADMSYEEVCDLIDKAVK